MIICPTFTEACGSLIMSINADEVKKIAHLARLRLDEQEALDYTDALSRILGLIEQMNAVDTTGVRPMAHPLDVHLRLREDTVTEPDSREKFQNIAPATEAGLYLVPRVLE